MIKKIFNIITDNFILSGALCAFYFFMIYKIFDINLDELKNLGIKEIGGLLGGIFSPLAFMMLIFGYIKEHKNTEFTKTWLIQERISQLWSIQPDFNFRSVRFNYSGDTYTSFGDYRNVVDKDLLHFDIQNLGEEATRVKFKVNNHKSYEISKSKKDQLHIFTVDLPITKPSLTNRKNNKLNTKITYTDKNRINREIVYSFEILKEKDNVSRYKVEITEISPAIIGIL